LRKYFCFINILGPESEAWGGLCITGSKQSPINIRHHEIVDHWDPLLLIDYGKYPHTMHIENNGHTAKVTVELEDGCHKMPQVIGGELPGKFELAQFHFHWGSKHSRGSEHTLSGVSCSVNYHIGLSGVSEVSSAINLYTLCSVIMGKV
jgi:carbonic anhydrase